MKPRNKFQAHIAQLSKAIPTITDTQKNWAYQHCFDHIAKRNTKGKITCLECGQSWMNVDTSAESCVCPHCGTKLIINDTRQRVFKQTEYLCVVTVCKGFQVLRFFYMDVYRKAELPAYYFCKEVVQRWIAPNGKYVTMARLRPMCCFKDTWIFSSDLEVRPDKSLYDIMPTDVYPRQHILSDLKRNGFKGEFYQLTPFEMLHTLLIDNRAETLLKAGQTNLLRHFVRSGHSKIENYWTSIRICVRNSYTVEDSSMWCDYIDLLRFFGKDTNSAKYVCPIDLKAEHDRMVAKREVWREREKLEEQREKMQQDEVRFKELKAKYFGISFTDGTIEVRVLESVQEFYEEGKCLKHCVYSNEYHLKSDSLILSACIDGKRVETVEISLKTLKVMQSRGVRNSNTEYHDQIINLVNKNKRLIRKRMAA